VRQVGASLISLAAITCLLIGFVGLLQSTTVAGLLVAGVLFIGGGLVLARIAWRVYRRFPITTPMPAGVTLPEARELAKARARQQWRVAAIFLLALVPAYLLVALLLEDADAAVGAAALVAITSAALGLMSWWLGRSATA